MNFQDQLNRYKQMVEDALHALPFTGAPEILKEAMRYSLLSGGKRLRGCLLLSACTAPMYMASMPPPTPAKKELIIKAIRLCFARLIPIASIIKSNKANEILNLLRYLLFLN